MSPKKTLNRTHKYVYFLRFPLRLRSLCSTCCCPTGCCRGGLFTGSLVRRLRSLFPVLSLVLRSAHVMCESSGIAHKLVHTLHSPAHNTIYPKMLCLRQFYSTRSSNNIPIDMNHSSRTACDHEVCKEAQLNRLSRRSTNLQLLSYLAS